MKKQNRICENRMKWGIEGGQREEWRKRSEFDRTLTELKAIAPAASMGFRSENAANGIPTEL